MGNKGAYIHLRGSDLTPEFHQFIAVVSGIAFLHIFTFIHFEDVLIQSGLQMSNLSRLLVGMQQDPKMPYMEITANIL